MVILRQMKGKEIVVLIVLVNFRLLYFFLFFLPIDIPVYSIHISYIYLEFFSRTFIFTRTTKTTRTDYKRTS